MCELVALYSLFDLQKVKYAIAIPQIIVRDHSRATNNLYIAVFLFFKV